MSVSGLYIKPRLFGRRLLCLQWRTLFFNALEDIKVAGMPALPGRNVIFEICNVRQYLNLFALGHTVQSASGGASSRFRFNFSEKGASWAILNAWVGGFVDVAVKQDTKRTLKKLKNLGSHHTRKTGDGHQQLCPPPMN